MKIVVCFKIVPDYEDVLPGQWAEPDGPDLTYVKKMIGCFDEAALESALRLADSLKEQGACAETVAVTAGTASGAVSGSLMRSLYAAGFEQVVILPEADPYQPWETARILAAWFEQEPADIIFTGKMVGPFDSGSVPFYLAEKLRMEVISGVTSARYKKEDAAVYMVRRNEKTEDSLRVERPCICVVGDAEYPYLRLFSIKARMEARKKEFRTFDVLNENTSIERKGSLRYEETKRECVWIDGDAEETCRTLAEMIREVRS